MSGLKVKSGKGELVLHKSKELVGLKSSGSKDLSNSDFVKAEVFKNLGGFNIVRLEKEGSSIDDKLDEARKRKEVNVGTHVYHTEGSSRPLVATGEIYIIFQDSTSEEEQLLALDEYKLELVERRSDTRIIAAVTKHSPNPVKAAHLLQQTSMIKLAAPDLDTFVDEYAPFVAPADKLISHQWHLRNTGILPDVNWPMKRGADAKVFDAWSRIGNTGAENIVIAVIDNGFDTTHPDLKDKIYKPFDLWNQSDKLDQGDSRFTHGTPCASVALAASNGNGIVGVAPGAKFMPVSGTSFSLRATEQMFDYCINNGADVISCSWGTTDPAFDLNPMKQEAIAKAARKGRNGKGCVIVYAVGNEDLDFVNFYAAHPDVIAVAASTSKDEHAPYSNRGREVTICAPSNGDWPILTARAWWDKGVEWETGNYKYYRDGRDRGSQYKHFGGTSCACPLVAGICALILSVNPELTAKEVKDIIIKTADKIGSPADYENGHSKKYGYGRINADKAVAETKRRMEVAAEPLPGIAEVIPTGHGIFNFNVRKQDAKGFGVQVGAFSEYGNVLIQVEKLQQTFNTNVIVGISEVNGRTIYKIVVGAYPDIENARSLHLKMKTAGINGYVRSLEGL